MYHDASSGKSYRVVAVTAAGRPRYMEILLRYMLRQRHIIDEWRFWVNTTREDDIAWMKDQERAYPDYIATDDPRGPVDGVRNLRLFYPDTTDDDTVYVKIDDDICFIDDDAIERLVEFTVFNDTYFASVANTVNNALIDHVRQRNGLTTLPEESVVCDYDCMGVSWKLPQVAEFIHEHFLRDLEEGRHQDHKRMCITWEYSQFERVSINFIAWRGEDMRPIADSVGEDDEEWFARSAPEQLGKVNALCPQSLVAHFSFYTQREYLEKTDLLERYRNHAVARGFTRKGFRKLLQVLDKIRTADREVLENLEAMEQLICEAGLAWDGRNEAEGIYASYSPCMNGPEEAGLWQIPRQLAELLLFLHDKEIRTFCEIGTYTGATFAIVHTYLSRLNDGLQSVTADVFNYAHALVGELPECSFLVAPPEELHEAIKSVHDSPFDLCFIDGNHSYECASRDYRAFGIEARFAVFHDITDRLVATGEHDGGVPRLWQEIKDSRPRKEFTYHPEGRNVMGIGVLASP